MNNANYIRKPDFSSIPTDGLNPSNFLIEKVEYDQQSGKYNKIPCDPNGYSKNFKSVLTTFDQAKKAIQDSSKNLTLAYATTADDGLIIIDADNCLNEDKTPKDWVKPLLQLQTYTEESLGGLGLRIIAKSDFQLYDQSGKPTRGRIEPVEDGKAEFYFDNKPLIITGFRYGDSPPEIQAVSTEEMESVFKHYCSATNGAKIEPKVRQMSQSKNLTAEMVKNRILRSNDAERFQELMDGDIYDQEQGKEDHSLADFRFMRMIGYWSNGSESITLNLFNQSKLSDRGKPEKYVQRTLNKVLQSVDEYYPWKELEGGKKSPQNGQKRPKSGEVSPENGHKVAKFHHPETGSTNVEKVASFSRHLSSSKKTPPALNLIDFRDLMQKEFEPTKFVVDGLLTEGLTLLAGRPKVGKSWLALSLAVEVAKGGKALNKIEVEKGKVIYIGLEDSEKRLQNRCMELVQDEEIDAGCLNFLSLENGINSFNKSDQSGLVQLENAIDDIGDVKLVVIDTLHKVQPNEDSTSYRNDYSFTADIQKLATKKGISILCITHTTKSQRDYVLDEIQGTTGVTAATDSYMVLRKGRDNSGELHISGRDIEAQELEIQFDSIDKIWKVQSDIERFKHAHADRQSSIHQHLQKHGSAKTADIAKHLESSRQSVHNALKRLEDKGIVQKDESQEKGYYMLAQQEPDFVEDPDFIESPTMNQIPQPEDLEEFDLEEESEDEPVYQDKVSVPAPDPELQIHDLQPFELETPVKMSEDVQHLVRELTPFQLKYLTSDKAIVEDLWEVYQADREVGDEASMQRVALYGCLILDSLNGKHSKRGEAI